MPGNTHVTTEDGDILATPMAGLSSESDGSCDLTVVPMPPEQGQSQTAAEVAALLDPWSQSGSTADGPGPDSVLVLAPFGAAASTVVGVAHTMTGLVLQTQPL